MVYIRTHKIVQMGSIISNIINYFYPLKDRVDRELNDWLVNKYSNNVYLVKIPQERINSKRKEIEGILSKGYF